MKIFGFFWLGLLSVLLLGCKKDPESTEPPLATIPSITMTPSVDMTVDSGNVLTFTWEVKGTSDNFSVKVSLSGEIISKEVKGSLTSPLSFSTDFIVHIIMNDGRESIRTVNIAVRPGVVFDPPKIFFIYDTTTIQYDGSFYIEWTTENTTSLWMNNTKVPINGHFMFANLKADSSIKFRAVGFGGVTQDSIVVRVGADPNPNLTIISSHPWRIKDVFGKNHEGDSLVRIIPSQLWLDDENYFYSSLWSEIWRYGLLVNRSLYQITDSTFIWGNGPYRIITLNKDTLKVEHWIPCFDCEGTDSTFIQATYISL